MERKSEALIAALVTTAAANSTSAEKQVKMTEGDTSQVGSDVEKSDGNPDNVRFNDVELGFGTGDDRRACDS